MESYWISGGGEVQIVIVSVVERAMPPLIVCRICHALQLPQIEPGDSSNQHSDSEK